VTPWGVDRAAITVPVLIVHGDDDRIVPVAHGRWLAAHLPSAELWELADEGHISTIADDEQGAVAALRWLAQRSG
jgi:pimeloyl-ACP methyl ester carboxylesterase